MRTSAELSKIKMASPQEKAQAVLWFAEFKSVILTQRKFKKEFNKNAPSRKLLYAWRDKFLATGSVLKKSGGARKVVSESRVEAIRATFARSPKKSVRIASRELAIPKSTVHDVLHKKLRLYAYKLQIVQSLKPDDKPKRFNFATDMLRSIEIDPNFLNRICFSDEATFHVCGTVNRHNSRIWGFLRNTWMEIDYRLDILRATKGAHVEVL